MEKQIYEEHLDFNDFSLRFCTSPQKQKRKKIKLYTDLEVEAIYEKFLHKKIPDQSSNFAENETLPVVANGEVKPLKSIFKILDLDLERLELPKKIGFMRVIFYSWQLSPKFELEIMTGQGDPAKYPDELQGYGVRILRIQNNLPKIQKDKLRD
ncbi:hypothetical protein [Leptospira interrogans]|uniref:hypothetical protein n=1 Tax=Leptospira interrogans TaxID=173 RepID=UPI0002BADF6A|nr:hypothetical protein BRAT_09575 [Leptospira interrogans serovar Bratislava]KLO76272.1 Uncharacterized protein AAY48_2768 [Leptospira interrogans serovar Muenchen]KWV28550.1 hypothetical protein LA702_0749 [Leptospira interrogans]